MAVDLDVDHWSPADAAELYEVARWGNGYFSVGPNGNLLVHPDKSPTKSIDLKSLVDRLQVRGIDLPILLRFAPPLRRTPPTRVGPSRSRPCGSWTATLTPRARPSSPTRR